MRTTPPPRKDRKARKSVAASSAPPLPAKKPKSSEAYEEALGLSKNTLRSRPSLADRMRTRGGRKALESKEQTPTAPVPSEFEDLSQVANPLWKKVDEVRKSLATRSQYNVRLVNNPEELWDAAMGYFKWAEEHPLYEAKVFHSQRGLSYASIPKMRVYTIEALCMFLGVSRETWNQWGKLPKHADLNDTVNAINSIIREQKFSGAAVDLFNAGFISKDLGLLDRQELSVPGGDGSPEPTSARSVLADRIARLRQAKD